MATDLSLHFEHEPEQGEFIPHANGGQYHELDSQFRAKTAVNYRKSETDIERCLSCRMFYRKRIENKCKKIGYGISLDHVCDFYIPSFQTELV